MKTQEKEIDIGALERKAVKGVEVAIVEVKKVVSGLATPKFDKDDGDSVVAYYKWLAMDDIRRLCYDLERNQFYDTEETASHMVKNFKAAQAKIERLYL